jgi:Domain of unknown function (DUF4124)
MHRIVALVAFTALAFAGTARAQMTEIYKCVDAQGRFTYKNDKPRAGEKCETVASQVNVVPATKPPPPQTRAPVQSPGNFPKETAAERASARERQRDILEKELATEQQLLAKARAELAGQESARSGDERNYARVLERLQPYKDNVDLHEKNIEALKRELGNLYR